MVAREFSLKVRNKRIGFRRLKTGMACLRLFKIAGEVDAFGISAAVSAVSIGVKDGDQVGDAAGVNEVSCGRVL